MDDEDFKKFIKYMEDSYGITPSDLRWLGNYHRSLTKYGDWIAKAVVVSLALSILSSVITLFVIGIRQAIRTIVQ